jgi:anti-anti-sigma factor
MKYAPVQNYINGQFVDASTDQTLPVISPLDGTVLSSVPLSAPKDLDAAVRSAKIAFHGWSHTPIKERVQVLFRYRYLLEKNIQELAALVSEENGKTMGEAVAAIRDEIHDEVSQGARKVLLNLAEVSYIDSAGLGELTAAYTSVKNRGGQLKLLNLTKRVHDLLQITKLSTVFELHDDEKTAIASFGS